ncbi:MAG TPA: KUP/HAK/KT family potassium transporter [Gammaproteobacteria bacterium]|nr:KUP/HAK/KT family potassium transporter [Gammaproteobacteria bacterium]
MRVASVTAGESPLASSKFGLSVVAMGVVFGDIGTSPLYALRACFSNVAGVNVTEPAVLGVLSLIFWSLTLVISVKYIGIILRADNNGEGGVLALTTRVLSERPLRYAPVIATVGLIGCALFYGDGVITPAVTVLSAVEGISVATPAFQDAVLPLAVIALVWLFTLQRRGTGAIGGLFGPMMLLWFLVLALLGVRSIAEHPVVLEAVNPVHAFLFFVRHSTVAFAVFGLVFLTVTGGEALYTDLGHFGRQPIATAWFSVVWPCLLLNYFGQGALLLSSPQAVANPFYLLAPEWSRVPLVVLATAASIVASQAVISGVFSITQQCQRLGYIPRVQVRHSSPTAIGQVYVPAVNWLVCIATVGLALGFGSSASLTNAYGVGVSCTMLIDSVLILVLLWGAKERSARLQFAVLCVLLALDSAFVLSNLGKVPTGGWFPILFGLTVFGLMRTWQRGRLIVTEKMRREERPVAQLLEALEQDPPLRAPGVAVFPTSNTTNIPRTLVRNLNMNGVLHEHTILFSLVTDRVPRVSDGGRVKVQALGHGLYRVVARAGFMEFPEVPRLLRMAQQWLPFRTDDAVYFLGRDDIVIGSPRGMQRWRKKLFIFLARNSEYAAASFAIPPSQVMEVGGQVEI